MYTDKNMLLLPLSATEPLLSLDAVVSGILIASLFVSVVIVFCVILIRLYFSKIKKYTAQLYQKDLDYQKDLKNTIIETQEQVLQHISQDLHDDAGQQLTSLNFQIENLKLDLPQEAERLTPVSEALMALSQSIRSISHALNNQLILQQDLFKAINSEVERLQKNHRIAFHLSAPENLQMAFGADEQIFIYRIFQESLNNIFKHARARNIYISLQGQPQFLLQIQDDGIGFNPDAAGKTGKSIGLQSMRNRAAQIGYGFDIRSIAGEGTTITLNKNSHNQQKTN